LAKLDKIKLPNTKIKLLQKLLAKAIEDVKTIKVGIDFSKRLQFIVDNERKESDVLKQYGTRGLYWMRLSTCILH
jgi:type I restriction enzyme R subunit